MDIKQIPIEKPNVQPYGTYFVTHLDTLVGVFIPVSQDYGKNMRWVAYTGFGSISWRYYTARELNEYISKFSPTENKVYQAYLRNDESVKFKVIDKTSIESMLKEHNTLNAHKTTARRTVARKPVRKPVRKTKRA